MKEQAPCVARDWANEPARAAFIKLNARKRDKRAISKKQPHGRILFTKTIADKLIWNPKMGVRGENFREFWYHATRGWHNRRVPKNMPGRIYT
jgi:hypothetical protein